MTEYAVGDKVRITATTSLRLGQVGEVVSVCTDDLYELGVSFDSCKQGLIFAFMSYQVELVRALVSAPRTVTVVV